MEGEGGPYRQFFTDISKELQGVLPLLIPCPNAQAKVWFNRDKWILTPSCDSILHLTMYEFLGRLMGMYSRGLYAKEGEALLIHIHRSCTAHRGVTHS